jgi:hypothetical protein
MAGMVCAAGSCARSAGVTSGREWEDLDLDLPALGYGLREVGAVEGEGDVDEEDAGPEVVDEPEG